MSETIIETRADMAPDPRRYFEQVAPQRDRQAAAPPLCVYLEVTNRCNLLCETCPRTFEALEPPADMSWALFTSIVDQLPGLKRAVLHGVGEPMLVRNLPDMIRYLKARGDLRAVQHQRDACCGRQSGSSEIIESGARRDAGVAGCGRCGKTYAGRCGASRFLWADRARCAASSRTYQKRRLGRRNPLRVAVADGAEARLCCNCLSL